MIIFAHRGDSGSFPENTLESYQSAAVMAADYIEGDIRLSKDGVVVISHDNNLSRTGSLDKNISDMTLDEIKAADVSFAGKFGDKFSGCKVPTAKEALSLFAKHGQKSILELKDINAAKPLKDVMDEVNYADRNAIIEVWSKEDAIAAQPYFPNAKFYFVSSNFSAYNEAADKEKYFAELQKIGFSGWAIHYKSMLELDDYYEFIYLAKKHNISLLAWNLDDENTVREALSLKVRRNGITARIDAISSNFPAMLKKVRAEKQFEL